MMRRTVRDFGYGRSREWSPWMVLGGLGLLFLLVSWLSATGALVLLALGGIFTFLSQRGGPRALLIPGGILLGLGAGVAGASVLGQITGAFGGAAVVGGLGAGFWFIHLFDRARRPFGRPAFAWARVPGTVLLAVSALLTVIGVSVVAAKITWLLLTWWPVLLIAGGLGLFLAGRRKRYR